METIKAADVMKEVKYCPSNSEAFKTWKLLLVWIKQKQLTGDNVSKAINCEKARDL